MVLLLSVACLLGLQDRCGTCSGSGQIVAECDGCGGSGIAGYTTLRGQLKALGCERCGGLAGDAYTGRQGSGRSNRACGACDGSGAGPAKVAEERKRKAEEERKAREEAKRKAKEEAERPYKIAREKALEEERRLAEKAASADRERMNLAAAERILRDLEGRLREIDRGALFDGQVVRTLPDLGGPAFKTLFEKGSRGSAPVDLRQGASDRLDADLTLDFAEIQGAPPRAPAARSPDPRDLDLIFPRAPGGTPAWLPAEKAEAADLAFASGAKRSYPVPRWRGPKNPGPKLSNPLIEQEKALKFVSAFGWEFLHSKDFEEMMFENQLTEASRESLGIPSRGTLSPAQNRILDERVQATIRTRRAKADELRAETLREMIDEIDKLGPLKSGEDYVRKTTFDPDYRRKIDEARDRVLERYDERLAQFGRELDADVKDLAGKILKNE